MLCTYNLNLNFWDFETVSMKNKTYTIFQKFFAASQSDFPLIDWKYFACKIVGFWHFSFDLSADFSTTDSIPWDYFLFLCDACKYFIFFTIAKKFFGIFLNNTPACLEFPLESNLKFFENSLCKNCMASFSKISLLYSQFL